MYMRLFVFFSRLWYWKNNMKLCGGYGCQCVFWRLVGKINVWWGGNDGLCHRVWLISILLSVQWWYLTSMSHIIFTHNFISLFLILSPLSSLLLKIIGFINVYWISWLFWYVGVNLKFNIFNGSLLFKSCLTIENLWNQVVWPLVIYKSKPVINY